MKVVRLLTAMTLTLAAVPSLSVAQVYDRAQPLDRDSEYAPAVDVWLDQVSYDRGAYIRPYFTTEPGAYVTVIRITSDGELRMMYPRRPDEQKPWALGQLTNDRLPFANDPSLSLHESSGNGFVFAIASYRPFDFRQFRQGNFWNTARLAAFGRHEDPFQVMRRFVDQILPVTADFSMDYEIYEIYSRGTRSYYASTYGYWGVSRYNDACYNAFGYRYSNSYRYSSFCGPYDRSYYGPIVIGDARRRHPGGNRPVVREPVTKRTKMKGVRPVVPDPMVPSGIETVQGQQSGSLAADRAAREYYERKRRAASSGPGQTMESSRRPETREPVIYHSAPPRYQPRDEAGRDRRIETRSQPTMQGRQAPRSEPRGEVRRETRSESPRVMSPRSEASRPHKDDKH